jgi:hypothetical protein
MSSVAGGFLGETFAGGGAASEAAPELTDAAGPEPLPGGSFAVVLRGAASAGRGRGSGCGLRSTCGIGIGGTNLSSTCATRIARIVKQLDGAAGGIARAGLSVAADTSRQRQILMAGNVLTPTISAPPETRWQCTPTILTFYGAI